MACRHFPGLECVTREYTWQHRGRDPQKLVVQCCCMMKVDLRSGTQFDFSTSGFHGRIEWTRGPNGLSGHFILHHFRYLGDNAPWVWNKLEFVKVQYETILINIEQGWEMCKY